MEESKVNYETYMRLTKKYQDWERQELETKARHYKARKAAYDLFPECTLEIALEIGASKAEANRDRASRNMMN